MTTTGTWLKTLDGADVYTEDNEWFWSHSAQGWFHAPGLLTSVPAPPIGTRVQDEYTRLTTGWPRLRDAFPIRNGVRGLDWVCGIACRGYLVWFSVWMTLHAVLFVQGANLVLGPAGTPWAYWHDPAVKARVDAQQGAFELGVLFIVIALCCLYILYMVYVTTVDSHKGALMLGAIVVGSAYYHWRSNQNNRHNQIIQAIRDGNRQ